MVSSASASAAVSAIASGHLLFKKISFSRLIMEEVLVELYQLYLGLLKSIFQIK